jgi:hypothetical protein
MSSINLLCAVSVYRLILLHKLTMTRIFTPALFLLVLMMMGTAVFAQTNNGSAKGTIINKKDNTPVDYASVAIKSLKDSSVVIRQQMENLNSRE